MASIVQLQARAPGMLRSHSTAEFINALNDLYGTALRLHRIAGVLEGESGADAAVSHLVKSATEIGCAAEYLLTAVRAKAEQR